MLAFDELDTLTEPILELYEVYIQSVLNEIARRLRGMKLTSSTAWMMQRLTESGLIYEHALKELEKLTGISEKELRRAFREAGVLGIRFDDTVYRAAGLKPLPLNMSPAMTQVLAAGLRKTGGVMRNLTMTTAMSAQNLFIEAADLAYMQVASGAFDYISAIRDAVEHVARKGLTVIRFPGRSEQLDVAMRRVVLTGIGQTTGELQLTRAQEMGVNLMQVSAHVGARNEGTGPMNHESWQGKVYSIVGSTPEYPNLAEVTGLGTVVGLHGVSCRHSMYPFYEGISEQLYTQKELDEYANQKVVYQGKEMSVYEATQQQRAIERKIRYWKRQKGALEAAGFDVSEELNKIKHYQAQMRDFLKQTGLDRQYEREKALFFVNDLSKDLLKIDFNSGENQRVGIMANVQNYYSTIDPGREFATPRPVMYNQFGVNHFNSDEKHKKRIPWIEEHYDKFIKAIVSPEIIEKEIRLRKDGYFSVTHIVDLGADNKENERFLAVALSLSKNPINGYHQITTIYPRTWENLFRADGMLRDKYLWIK